MRLAARVLCERQFNVMLSNTRNKASALFSIVAIHLDQLLRNYGEQNLTIVCDRQGGREHYGRLLRLMFEEWALEVVCEADGDSEYLLTRNGHTVRLMSPEYVRPYVKAQKNDDRDAEAIAEAATRPTMRFVQLEERGVARHADTTPSARPSPR